MFFGFIFEISFYIRIPYTEDETFWETLFLEELRTPFPRTAFMSLPFFFSFIVGRVVSSYFPNINLPRILF